MSPEAKFFAALMFSTSKLRKTSYSLLMSKEIFLGTCEKAGLWGIVSLASRLWRHRLTRRGVGLVTVTVFYLIHYKLLKNRQWMMSQAKRQMAWTPRLTLPDVHIYLKTKTKKEKLWNKLNHFDLNQKKTFCLLLLFCFHLL